MTRKERTQFLFNFFTKISAVNITNNLPFKTTDNVYVSNCFGMTKNKNLSKNHKFGYFEK